MEKDPLKRLNFFYSLALTLGTIIIGLISYIYYSENILDKQEAPRCEYNGWAYADQETFQSTDGCNTCFCDDGSVICTEIACNTELLPSESF